MDLSIEMTNNILSIIESPENKTLVEKTESVFDFKNKASIKSPKKIKTTKKESPKSKPKPLKQVRNPIMATVSEAAKIGGVKTKTVRRAIQSKKVSYTVDGNRYFVDLSSMLEFLRSNKKLKNKLEENGIGQFIEKWRI